MSSSGAPGPATIASTTCPEPRTAPPSRRCAPIRARCWRDSSGDSDMHTNHHLHGVLVRPLALIAGLAAVLLSACGGRCGRGGGGGFGAVSGGSPSAGPGTVQVLDLASGTLGAATLDGASFDPPASLVPGSVAFRQVLAGSSLQGSPPGSLGAQSG